MMFTSYFIYFILHIFHFNVFNYFCIVPNAVVGYFREKNGGWKALLKLTGPLKSYLRDQSGNNLRLFVSATVKIDRFAEAIR